LKHVQKCRVEIWFLILMILLYFSIGCCYEGYRLEADFIGVSNVHDFIVDGTDFTLMILPLGYALNVVLYFIVRALYVVIIIIANLILLLPFRLVALNKKCYVTETEYLIYKYSYMGALLLSAVLCVILTRFTCLVTAALYNGIWAVFALVFVLIPAKRILR